MGNKVTEEQIAVVRSVVGDEWATEMDIIRALHLANNDATAAINIILDTPPRRKKTPISYSPPPPPLPNVSDPNPTPKSKLKPNPTAAATPSSNKQLPLDPCPSPSDESDWWLAGSSEIAGLSTCKGRRIKPGEKLSFSFPAPPQLKNSPSPTTKFPAGRRGFSSLASSSEIVRFSTQENGEVIFFYFLPPTIFFLKKEKKKKTNFFWDFFFPLGHPSS